MKYLTLKNKSINRFIPILLNGLKSILSPILSIVFSYLIINYFSKTLWGDFVYYLLFFHIASIISNWGNKMFLLRNFSEFPKDNISNFQEYFLARIPILFLIIIVIYFVFGINELFYLVLWMIGLFFYNSLMPVIIYFRDFGKQMIVEIISFAVLILLINYFKNEINIFILVKCYSLYFLIKSVLILVIYNRFFQFKTYKVNLNLLKLGFPFLILAITGFLQSKIDVYTFSFYSGVERLGEYQVISGFFIFLQALASIIIFPYAKNIYRMAENSIFKIKKIMILYGALMNIILLILIYFILLIFFDIKLDYLQLALGFIISYPLYIYTVDIFNLIRLKKEKKVITVSFICMSVSFIIAIILLKFNRDFTSVLIANATGQLISLILYNKSVITSKF